MMKKIFLITALLLSCYSFSQRGFGNMNNTNQIPQNSEEELEERREKEQKEGIQNLMTRLNEELKLNQLQYIAIEQIYTDSNRKQGIIFKKQIPEDEKREALISLSESTENKMVDLLNSEQKEKYLIIKPELMKGLKKEPKKEKKKKKKEDKEE